MKNVWKLVCLMGFIVLVAMTVLVYTVFFQLPSQEVFQLVLSVGILLLAGCAVHGINYVAFTKRHTTATGFG